jgi:PII-like signaling protein
MLPIGPGVKVTVYLNEDTGAQRSFLENDILAYLQARGVNGATVHHAHAGFGAHRRLHTSGAGDVEGLHLPVVICFVDTREKVDSLLPDLLAMVTDGLVEAHPTEILKNISTSARVIS